MKKDLRLKVLNKCNGNCAYCGTPLDNRFHVDHKIPVKRISTWVDGKFKPTGKMENPELDVFENMLPACASCNICKSSFPLEYFREILEDKVNQLERESNYRIAKRFGLIKETPKKIVFYFEEKKHGN